MIIDCAHYVDGRRRDEGPLPLQEAAARCAEGGFVWLGMFEPAEEEVAQVRRLFGLHELAVEDALTSHRRPKIESYGGDLQLVILRTAHYDDVAEAVDFGEIGVFFAPAFVITIRRGLASETHKARKRLEQRPDLLAAGSSSVLWAIMDEVVEDYAPVVAGLERDVDEIEATVFSGAVAPAADVPHRLLRPELRLAGRPRRQFRRVPYLRRRRSRGGAGAVVLMAQAPHAEGRLQRRHRPSCRAE